MATNAQKTVDWAEDGEPDLATAIPAPQVSKNKDGTETVVTIFINEDGKKSKAHPAHPPHRRQEEGKPARRRAPGMDQDWRGGRQARRPGRHHHAG